MKSELNLVDTKWVSFALYIHSVDDSHGDELIVNIHRLLDENNIDYFYVRLNEETPVIKVRAKINSEQKPLLYSCLQNAFKKVNFVRKINRDEYYNSYRSDLVGLDWKEHGFIQEQKYLYEEKRYGKGIKDLVEKSYVISTKIIANTFNKNLSLIEKMIFSYYMNKGLLNHLKQDEVILGISETWEDYIVEMGNGVNKLNQAREINFEKFHQTIGMPDYIQNLFHEVKLEMDEYNNIILQIMEKLGSENDYCETPVFSKRLSSYKKQMPFLNVFIGLIHMNNIRLGIKPIGEVIFYRYIHSLWRKNNEYN